MPAFPVGKQKVFSCQNTNASIVNLNFFNIRFKSSKEVDSLMQRCIDLQINRSVQIKNLVQERCVSVEEQTISDVLFMSRKTTYFWISKEIGTIIT